MIRAQAGVSVPGAGCAFAVKDLDKADAAFGKAARCEHLLAEGAGDVLVKTIEPAGGFVFFLEAKHLGNGRLHPKGELVRLDPGAELGVRRVLECSESVEAPQKFGLHRAFPPTEGYAGPGERKRIGRVNFEDHT